jgi:cytochrome c-type biogenesis protein CcmF
MPWLVGTALIHSSIVVEKRDTLKSWTILLAIITFSLSLVGTFLVRSGVLNSVHSFASDPQRGTFILLLLIVAIGGSLTLYAVRAPALKGGGVFAPISREGALVLNNLLLSCGCATVFLGTMYPLFLDAMGGPKISVGFPFFNRTFVPMMVPMLMAVGLGPMMAWKRGDLLGALQRVWVAYIATVAVLLIAFYVTHGGPVLAVLGFGLATWLGAAVLVELAERLRLFRIPLADSGRRALHLPRSAYGMTIAHFGLAVSIAGFSASAFDREAINALPFGGSLDIAGYHLTLESVDRMPGPNYVADRASIRVTYDGALVKVMHPERRFFTLQQQTTAETSIRTNLLSDLYVAMGDTDAKGVWTIRAYWKPLVPFIWIGCVIMAFGGAVSLSDRRWRVGVAARARGRVDSAVAVAGE